MKRISYFLKAFFQRKNRNKGIKKIFFKHILKTQTNGKMFLKIMHGGDGFTVKSDENQEKKGFSKRILLRKESMIFDFFHTQNDFWRRPKKKIGKRTWRYVIMKNRDNGKHWTNNEKWWRKEENTREKFSCQKGSKNKKTFSSSKKLTTDNFEFL